MTADEFESANYKHPKVKLFPSFQNHDIIPTVRRIIGKSPMDDLVVLVERVLHSFNE